VVINWKMGDLGMT